jgi:hypothetical protein
LIGGFLIACGAIGALQLLGGVSALFSSSEPVVPGTPGLTAWGIVTGSLLLAGVAEAVKWAQTGATLITMSFAGLVVLGFARSDPWGVVAGLLFLLPAIVLLAAAPWNLRCVRCGSHIGIGSTQCGNCGKIYFRSGG